jgi:HK97 family phage major capsid protein
MKNNNPLAEWVIARAASRHAGPHGSSALTIACDRFGIDSPATRSLLASVGSMGGYLVAEGESKVVIDALRPLATVRRHTPAENIISMPRGNIRMGKETASAGVKWIGEATQVDITAPSYGEIFLQSKKAVATLVVSNDLLRYAQPDAADIIERGLLKQLAAIEDKAFLTSPGSQYQPKGLVASAGTSNASTGSTAAQVIADLTTTMAALESANVRLKNPCWFVSTAGRDFLATLVSSSGQFQFPEVANGTLFGWPLAATTAMSGDVLLADMADVYIGQGICEVSLHNAATYTLADGSATVNSFDRDESSIRIVSATDIALAHKESAAVISSVSWA